MTAASGPRRRSGAAAISGNRGALGYTLPPFALVLPPFDLPGEAMRLRLLGGSLLAVLLALLAIGPVAAVEEDHDDHALPSIEEVGTGSEVAEQFRPEPPERQPFTDALLWPLLAGALVLAFVILLLYLRWMPRFSQEKSSSQRR